MASTKTRINKIANVIIPVTDQDGMIAFYVDKLGFTKRVDEPFGGQYRWVEVGLGDESTTIALAPPPDGSPTGGNQTGITLQTDDIDAVHTKLKAAGVDVDREALDVAQPQLADDEPSFEAFWQSVAERRPVTFGYRRSAAATPAERRLQPWGIVSYRSRWYVVGHDLDRDAPRMFRLSRVTGQVRFDGPAGSFEVPEGTDLRRLASALAPEVPERTASALVRPGRAVAMRHRATSVEESVSPGWDRVEVPFGRTFALADELASYGVTETLQHDDLHDGQVFVREGRQLILDWGDCVISHPFFTLSVTLEGVVAWGLDDVENSVDIEPLVDRYLRRYDPDRPELKRAVPLALRLGWACRAANGTVVEDPESTQARLRMFLDGRA